jgi:hypothetical protein
VSAPGGAATALAVIVAASAVPGTASAVTGGDYKRSGHRYMWIGAVDGLRINRTVHDFEADGVRAHRTP